MGSKENVQNGSKVSKADFGGYKFGTFKGVFTPSILTILGVIMFLRFGWVLGNLGLFETLMVVTLATSITFLTALSISELATNMKIGGGGAYYIISRSLGIEAGAAIGLPLFFAQALGISFYIAGFSESVVSIFPQLHYQIVGVSTLVVLFILAFISANLALRLQYIILVLIISALISFFLGDYTPQLNLVSDTAAVGLPFWVVFAVFFPAVTGIEAGLSMSGDLKDPGRSLPKGTIAAVLVSYLIYLAIPIFMNSLNIDSNVLISNSMIMRDVSKWGKLVYCGLWGAALSSAMGALLGSPRTLQALAKDGVIPKWIGRGYGKSNNPRTATVFAFIIALIGILLGDLNVIAPILSMFFLTSYGLLNLSAAFGGILNNPSWRPKFRVHWAYSLIGSVGCLVAMFMINSGATFIAILFTSIVYYIMEKRKLNAYWGDIRYGVLMHLIRAALYSLSKLKPHENTWRPNILVLSGSPTSRWYLVELADAISHGKGFLTVATILSDEIKDGERIENMQSSIQKYLEEKRVPAIVKVANSQNIIEGAKGLIQNYGFGVLSPNTVLLGDVGSENNFNEYASLLLMISKRKKNLIIVRESDKAQPVVFNQRIDIWWRRIGDNSGLMLVLAYLLKTSPEWQGSILRIKTIVDKEEEKEEQFKQLSHFISTANMDAEIHIFIKDKQNPYDMIRERSSDANVVFVGMKTPQEDETSESYSDYYTLLQRAIDGLPTTVMVLASENLDFNNIFKL